MAAPAPGETVAQLLVRRLRELGCTAVHGVPGDYSFGLCDAVEDDEGVAFVTTASELAAGYAADGYARVNGIGALLTTFGVGELSAVVRSSRQHHARDASLTRPPECGGWRVR
jgi:TPP-dependent 2-oxoacid decarboxylase